jgi:hypothetical protein
MSTSDDWVLRLAKKPVELDKLASTIATLARR